MRFLVLLLVGAPALAAQVPYLRTSVGSVELPRVAKSGAEPDRDTPTGAGTLSTRGTTISYDFSGGRLAGNRLSFDSLVFSAHFDELTLTTSKIVPVIKIQTVRKEKIVFGKRVVYDEPVQVKTEEPKPLRSSHQNVKVTALTKPGAGISVLLPERVPVRLSPDGAVHIKDKEALARAFSDSLDKTLGDEAFWNGLEIRTENLPGIVDFALAQRDLWRKPVVDALKKELTKEAFLESLERSLTEGMPPLQLNGKDLDAEIGLAPDGYLDVALGRAIVGEKLARGYRFQVETDRGGLTLALRAFLSLLQEGRASLNGLSIDKTKQVALLPLEAGERGSAAQLLTDLGVGRFEAATLSALGIDLSGRNRPVAELSGDELSITIPFVALPVHEGVAPFPFALKFRLKVENGRLSVLGLVSETPGKAEGTAWEKVQAALRLLAVNALANREASKLQAGAPNLNWRTLSDPEPRLQLTIAP